ncbi:unnamed protein product [Arctogadus glacialis]
MPMMFIDHQNGIYVTPKYQSGPLFPIHVTKSTTAPVIDCELENCQQLMKIGTLYTDKIENWYKFGRTRVSFDLGSGRWNCQCGGTGRSHRCIHRKLAMWWIFQESTHHLLPNSEDLTDGVDDLETEIHMSEAEMSSYAESQKKVCEMTEYLLSSKKIPPPHDLSVDLRSREKDVPTCFIPEEKTCPYCPGPTPPDLLQHEIITNQAAVYGYTYINKGISVAIKQCPVCQNHVRFQEYKSGFHHFNDRVFLTLPLCELLLSALANKTAPGCMLSTLTFFNDNRFHHQTVRKAFHHFLALMNYEFKFSCSVVTLHL